MCIRRDGEDDTEELLDEAILSAFRRYMAVLNEEMCDDVTEMKVSDLMLDFVAKVCSRLPDVLNTRGVDRAVTDLLDKHTQAH